METADSSNALDVSARTEDLKYMQALTVNVSNFVSVKLSGHSNYKIWKAQMLCLIESQLLLHIVDAENQFPVDKGVHMIRQYDKLVKGWIFGSVNEKVLKDLVDLGTAQEVWMKLGSLFNLPTSNTEADSSNALGVSAPDAIAPVVYAMREDLKYNQALNVDVSNFVSEKLEGKRNYYTWKNEMLSLIRSHELLHIIRDKARFPWDEGDPMTQKYDSLVRGWILNNMNNFLRDKYRMYRSVQEMWMRLESTYNYLPKTRDSSKGDTKDNSSSEIEDMEYMQLKSNVNVSNFVSVKLCGRSNYNIWKDQILHLLQSHSLLHILDEEARSQQYKNDPMTKKYESLVRGWILGAMNNEERHKYRIYQSVKLMWSRVNSTFGETKDSKYTEASNVKLSYIVRVNLSNNSNYSVWKAHMLYLLEWQSLLHIINDEYCSKEDKYHELVKGWLLCTMNDELLKDFPADNHVKHTAKHLWKILESHFSKDEPATSPVFEFRRAEFVRVPEIEDTDSSKIKKELYEAAVEGCWWKAKSILKIHKNAATEAITTIGDTILHLAVETGHNYFLEKLLDFIEDGEDIEKKNDKGRTALHIAAVVGNTHAAQLLVKKRSQLLQILDCDEKSPLDICYTNVKVNTCAYLLKSRITYGLETYSIFEEPAIMSAIITKDYDSAQSLLEKFPECASQDKYMLFSLTITFPSDLGFIETFIYPCIF